MTRVAVEGGEVFLISAVSGLVSEAQRVRDAFLEAKPRAVALGISPESAAAILRYQPVEGVDPFDDLPDAELAYSLKLQDFGEVALPPPDLVEAARLAKEAGISVYGVDLTEEQYEDLFTARVSAWGLLRYGRAQRKLIKKPPVETDARAFSIAWDARIRKVKAMDALESAREARIASNAKTLAKQTGIVLLVVDAPREAGVLAALRLP